MSKGTIGIMVAAAVLVAGWGVLVLLGPRGVFGGFDRSRQVRYERISYGDSQRAVVDALGEPNARTTEFNLPQRHGFEHLFENAEKSSAVEYLQWINGSNWYYCIGFDATGAAVVKAEGHS